MINVKTSTEIRNRVWNFVFSWVDALYIFFLLCNLMSAVVRLLHKFQENVSLCMSVNIVFITTPLLHIFFRLKISKTNEAVGGPLIWLLTWFRSSLTLDHLTFHFTSLNISQNKYRHNLSVSETFSLQNISFIRHFPWGLWFINLP